jgi:predicted nucleotidyltransferase
LEEVLKEFGKATVQRRLVSMRLRRIYALATATRQVKRFIVFGSFVTGKPEPNDVDVFLLMDDTFDLSQVAGEAKLLFEHSAAQAHFGASIFWLRRLAALPSESDAVHSWERKRDGTRRGIVEIEEGRP